MNDRQMWARLTKDQQRALLLMARVPALQADYMVRTDYVRYQGAERRMVSDALKQHPIR